MSIKNTPYSYGKLTKILHGFLAIFVPLFLLASAIMTQLPSEAPFLGTVYNLHKLSGLLVLSVMLVFLLWTLTQKKPVYPDSMAAWEKNLARIVRYSLYAVVIAMPLSGWVMTSASHHAPVLFHWKLLLPMAKNKVLAKQLAEVHWFLAWTLAVILILHVAGALKHHFIDKNTILRRMWH